MITIRQNDDVFIISGHDQSRFETSEVFDFRSSLEFFGFRVEDVGVKWVLVGNQQYLQFQLRSKSAVAFIKYLSQKLVILIFYLILDFLCLNLILFAF